MKQDTRCLAPCACVHTDMCIHILHTRSYMQRGRHRQTQIDTHARTHTMNKGKLKALAGAGVLQLPGNLKCHLLI